MCSGNCVRLIAVLLPGSNTDIGNQAALTGKFALRVGITQACRAQVVQGEICYLGSTGFSLDSQYAKPSTKIILPVALYTHAQAKMSMPGGATPR